MSAAITVVIPTIPPRAAKRERAVHSAMDALRELENRRGVGGFVLTVEDKHRDGAAVTRHRGLLAVITPWVAFLDDDDVMHPDHLVELYGAAVKHNATFLWSRFQIKFPDGRTFQGPQFLGEKAFSQWDDEDPCQTTITTLVSTELAQRAGGFLIPDAPRPGFDALGNRVGEDHEFALRCRAAGGVMRHVEKITWDWWHHESNTSGLPIW